MNGQHDSPLILRQGKILQRLYRKAEYELIPVASHLSNVDNPVYFHLAMERFLRNSSKAIQTDALPDQNGGDLVLDAVEATLK
jgi:hypothetical protein